MVRSLIIGSAASIVSLIAGGPLIAMLEHFGIRKAISEEGPGSHMVKAGTVTMGGLLILAVILAFTIPTNLAGHRSILLPLGVMGAVGLIGMADDLMTIQGRARLGGHERLGLVLKTVSLMIVGLVTGLVLVYSLEAESLNLPHFGGYEMGAAYVVVAIVVMTATTSATAVTDGLDGLLAGVMMLAFASYGVIAFLQGQSFLATFCFTVVGALIGFLWFNALPALVFMGEAGAMPPGAGLAPVALMPGGWTLLPVAGLLLLAEVASLPMQLATFPVTCRGPLRGPHRHHHFELAGWSEPQVVVRFWLAGAVGALLGIALALTD